MGINASLSSTCERRFHIAKNLYRLALDNILSFVNGVDQLCYVAMFNNMSHVLKTLQGYNSQEVYHFDMLLFKAINWWKETHSSSFMGNESSNNTHSYYTSTNTNTNTN